MTDTSFIQDEKKRHAPNHRAILQKDREKRATLDLTRELLMSSLFRIKLAPFAKDTERLDCSTSTS